ncbi:MAG: MFS transporter [Gammaproteobacteria bacterium 28-57-27]|nr:MAG: MFS transporter [Gammaproteobacteria bacterium 28-57-27]
MTHVSSTVPPPPANSARRILFASLIGTTIEFFDFYIYATAAALVFPRLFFPESDPTTATLQSLATFALAFFARPIGAALFGHFGDRVGRKATLVAALLTMGISTVAIGLLPTYVSIGIAAPILLAIFRFGQGLGLGGEWGGAVLLATENAPPGKRAWFGMFPQLGAPIGFVLSTTTFLLLTALLTEQQFFDYGWRIPFIASAVLVILGLYVRLQLTETPAFSKAMENNQRVLFPASSVFRHHWKALILGTVIGLSAFVTFYLMTVFALTYGTSKTGLGYSRETFLFAQLFGVLFFAITIPISALLADKYGRRLTLMAVTVAVFLFGFALAPLFGAGSLTGVVVFLAIGLGLMGLTYGPLGTILSELFPTAVRYTGSSLAFNLSGIFGAALAPYIATWLASHYGLAYVGYYLSATALLTLIGLLLMQETRDKVLE